MNMHSFKSVYTHTHYVYISMYEYSFIDYELRITIHNFGAQHKNQQNQH